MIPPPSTIVWRDYATDPPNPPNGFFLVLTRATLGSGPSTVLHCAEAQRWMNIEGLPNLDWVMSDGNTPLDEDDILYWAALPDVFISASPAIQATKD